MVNAVLDNWRTAPIAEDMRATLGYLAKLSMPSQKVESEDIARMKEAGVSRTGMEEATLVALCFQTMTRLADALNFNLSPPDGVDFGGRFLYKNGYTSTSLPG